MLCPGLDMTLSKAYVHTVCDNLLLFSLPFVILVFHVGPIRPGPVMLSNEVLGWALGVLAGYG